MGRGGVAPLGLLCVSFLPSFRFFGPPVLCPPFHCHTSGVLEECRSACWAGQGGALTGSSGGCTRQVCIEHCGRTVGSPAVEGRGGGAEKEAKAVGKPCCACTSRGPHCCWLCCVLWCAGGEACGDVRPAAPAARQGRGARGQRGADIQGPGQGCAEGLAVIGGPGAPPCFCLCLLPPLAPSAGTAAGIE